MGWVHLSLAIAAVILVGAQAQIPILLNGTSAATIQTSNNQLITITVAGVSLSSCDFMKYVRSDVAEQESPVISPHP